MSSPVVDNFMLNLRCKKPGHENMPILYVCSIGSCKDKLNCATCMISSHQHHEKNLINFKQFLQQYVTLEEEKDKIVRDNQVYSINNKDNNDLKNIKEEQDMQIEDVFKDMMKLTKILYESAMDKFLINNKSHHDSIMGALDETQVMLNKKEQTIKEAISQCPGDNYERV